MFSWGRIISGNNFPELKKKKGLSVSLCNYRQPPSATTMAKILTMLLTVDDDVVVCGAATQPKEEKTTTSDVGMENTPRSLGQVSLIG